MASNPHGYPMNFHQGTRAEYLAQFALSRVGLVVPVPRPSDHFLTDLFVHLGTQVKTKFVPTGPTIALQVKSSRNPIVLKDRKREIFLRELAHPYFITVIDVGKNVIEIYSTQERLNHAHMGWQTLTLRFGESPPGHANNPSDPHGELYLRQPIYKCTLADLDDPESGTGTAQRMHEVLREWARIESINLAWFQHGFPLFLRPSGTETNDVTQRLEPICISTDTTVTSAIDHLDLVAKLVAQMAAKENFDDLKSACNAVQQAIAALPRQGATDLPSP